MGCFSFMCKNSGKAVTSSSFSGDLVHLFLLDGGKVIEHMYGQYDSYGRVFHTDLEDSFQWSIGWDNVCNLMFSGDYGDGIAAILDSHYTEGEYPTKRSESDPNQGWGEGGELLGDCSGDIGMAPKEAFHKVMK